MPLLREIESLSERIQEYDEWMEKIAQEMYPEVSLLKQVKGVGTQIALTYVLTIEDPYRFAQQSRGGLFSGVKTWTQELRGERTTEAHQQRRRPVSANDDGAGGRITFWGHLEKTVICGRWGR